MRNQRLWKAACLTAAVLGVVLPCGHGLAQEAEKDIYYYYNAYTEAYKNQDYQGYLENLEGALSLRPEHPRIMYNLASANALLGNHDQAFTWLERLSSAGMTYAAASDSDFVALWGTDRFNAIRERFTANEERVGSCEEVFRLPQKGLIAESVALDSVRNRFLVSSVREKKILQISMEGEVSDFSGPQDGLLGVFGLKIDEDRGILWACTGAVPQMEGYTPEDEGKTGLLGYDLNRGVVLHRVALPQEEGVGHLFGDMALAQNGIYVTDSYGPRVYFLPQDGTAFELFAELDGFVSPQGLALSPDGGTLYVADYLNGIKALNVHTKEQTLLSHGDDVILMGIDGMYLHRGDLICIQNGVRPNRVVRLELDGAAITGCTVLEANHPDFEEPTLGMVRDGVFYFVGSSQWGAVGQDGALAPEEELKPHIVFKRVLN